MNKIKIMRFLLIIFSFYLPVAFASDEPTNLDVVKQRLMHYHDSGRYAQEQAHVINQAKQYLSKRLAMPHKRKFAIVLDIDETSLSNYAHMVNMSFGGTLKQIDAEEEKGTDTAIFPTLQLYQYAKQHHVAVFFVTGRREYSQIVTINNLRHAGFQQFDGLILKPNHYHLPSVVPFKVSARKYLVDHGYDVVLNVGDQMSDLQGGFADRAFKLPNPYYLIH